MLLCGAGGRGGAFFISHQYKKAIINFNLEIGFIDREDPSIIIKECLVSCFAAFWWPLRRKPKHSADTVALRERRALCHIVHPL